MTESYKTIQVRVQQTVCTIQFDRPDANNTINGQLVDDVRRTIDSLDESIQVLVLEGDPKVFCFGADFKEIHAGVAAGRSSEQNPEPLYDLWSRLAEGPWVSIAHVRGKVNAGGIGFVAACDIVLADETAVFSLSELLFGLFPACVLPFLIRRVGFQKAHYMTLMTQPVPAAEAHRWGLVDAIERDSANLLRKHLLRLRRLSRDGIIQYKRYMHAIGESLVKSKPTAIAANRELFSNPATLKNISRYVETGRFPWED